MEKEGRYIPNSLKYYRRLMKYKQTEVAQMLGLQSANRISRWERGLATPNLENLIKLSIIYRTLMNELYSDLFQTRRHELSEKNIEMNGMFLR